MTKLWYLRNLDMFNLLSEQDQALITAHTRLIELKKRSVLYFEGSEDDSLYLLKAGALKVTRQAPKGNEIILDILGPGSILGEIADNGRSVRDETAIAVEDSAVCSITRADFTRVIRELPGFPGMAKRFKGPSGCDIENKLMELLYLTVEQRLAVTLLKLLKDFGAPHEEGRIIDLNLTHSDYADLIASTRETVSAVLGKLRKAGAISYSGRKIVVLSEDALRELVG